ncbi:MAG: multicopper oxidase domain-containing protein [Rubrobacteraceae bacterium]|nr:multicopper oxidase domain-containing protein [Rubrobacteraceae bacterium]
MSGMGGGSEPRQWTPDIVYPYYLINGKPPDSPEELMVKRGERLRLRFINPASATIFRVALAGHRMTVTHTDGQPVEPVDVDALRIGPGERYDVIVEANNPGVWQLAAQAEGTEKMGRAILRYRGSSGSAPPAGQKPPELGKKLLLYGMLRAASGVDLPSGSPDQVTPVTLSGNERRYVWRINGKSFHPGPNATPDPITAGRNKHIRFEFMNMSMMPHPMHLHGHSFQVDNGTGRGPLKDTAIVDPMQRFAVDWYADNPGDWAFHCHHLYHMEAGMMRVVRV